MPSNKSLKAPKPQTVASPLVAKVFGAWNHCTAFAFGTFLGAMPWSAESWISVLVLRFIQAVQAMHHSVNFQASQYADAGVT